MLRFDVECILQQYAAFYAVTAGFLRSLPVSGSECSTRERHAKQSFADGVPKPEFGNEVNEWVVLLKPFGCRRFPGIGFYSPKGWEPSAQGKEALRRRPGFGYGEVLQSARLRAGAKFSQPFRLPGRGAGYPGRRRKASLPWATSSQPFGLKTRFRAPNPRISTEHEWVRVLD